MAVKEKTKVEMDARLSTLRGMLANHELSLSLSAELDAIQNHGLEGWNEYLRKRDARKYFSRR